MAADKAGYKTCKWKGTKNQKLFHNAEYWRLGKVM